MDTLRQLRNLHDLRSFKLQAKDGEIGKLREVYFDDKRWVVRYFIVRTGTWLLGSDVLIVPAVVKSIDDEHKNMVVDLSREQIENAPPVDTQKPVSRHYEDKYYSYYGWQPYWDAGAVMGGAPLMPFSRKSDLPEEPENPNLRSSDEVHGYHISTQDDKIGHVEDFILDDKNWAIRYLQIDTRNWLPGKDVLLSPAWIQRISWSKRKIEVRLTRQAIESAPTYDESQIISPEYEKALYEHYGMQAEAQAS